MKELETKIMSYMDEEAYRPLRAEDLAEGMNESYKEILDVLRVLEADGRIVKNRMNLYGIPRRMHLAVGHISMSTKGFGFVIPTDLKDKEAGDVFVPGGQTASAMHGDLVLVRLSPAQQEGRAREGEVLRILKRVNEKIVGTFERSKSFGFVTPDNAKLGQDIFISKKFFAGAKTGSKVVVKIDKWPEKSHNAEGRIVEVLGKTGDPGVDVLAVMRSYDLVDTFPEAVQAQADRIEKEPNPNEYGGRKDVRNLPIVTIDGDDSKDLDDGVYAKKNADGSYFLGVYIADVSHYVQENSPLDREAKERGTSVYLVDRVIPMLPKALSNGICSLNAGVDRLSMACEMQLSRTGEIMRYEILPCVIHVYRRLTYNLVNKILVDKEPRMVEDNEDILPMMETLAEIRNLRKNIRRARGSIDFEIPEIKVKLDEKGHPVALVKRTGSLAESIIEECMLAANETVAEHMDKRRLPFLYRVHEQPTEEKLERLNMLLTPFNLYVRKNEKGEVRPLDIQQVVAKVQGKPEERLVSATALRSMQQARYAADSLGHFGLSARYYTHFTSPIRRYPDLIVHRLLREAFRTNPKEEVQEKRRAQLPEIAEHSSRMERIATEAERETTDMKKIEYMMSFVGDAFDGIISGVTAFGIFVELDNGVEGLVHVSTMANDYYDYKEERYALVGQRGSSVYRMGDPVRVVLIRANIEERNLDFVLEDNSAYRGDFSALRKGKQALPSADVLQKETRQGSEGRKEEPRAQGRKRRRGKKQKNEALQTLPKADELIAEIEKPKNKKPQKREQKQKPQKPLKQEKAKIEEKKDGKVHETERKCEQKGKRKPAREVKNFPAEAPKRQTALPKSSLVRKARKKEDPFDFLPAKAVWPDPPGYREQKLQREVAEETSAAKSEQKKKPRPFRKTEGTTGNGK